MVTFQIDASPASSSSIYQASARLDQDSGAGFPQKVNTARRELHSVHAHFVDLQRCHRPRCGESVAERQSRAALAGLMGEASLHDLLEVAGERLLMQKAMEHTLSRRAPDGLHPAPRVQRRRQTCGERRVARIQGDQTVHEELLPNALAVMQGRRVLEGERARPADRSEYKEDRTPLRLWFHRGLSHVRAHAGMGQKRAVLVRR